MKIPVSCALLTLLLPLHVPARDFADTLPEKTSLLFQIEDVAGYSERVKETPLGTALAKINWINVAKSLGEMNPDMEDEEGNTPDLSPDDWKKMEERFATLKGHFKGTFAISAGDFTDAARLIAKHKKEREALYGGDEAEDEQSDEQFEADLNRELNMDALEGLAFASQFRVLAVVQDGEGLLKSLESWARSDIQNATEDEIPEEFKELEIEGTTVYAVLEGTPEDAEEADKALAALQPGAYWALVDDVWVLGFSEEGIRTAIRDLQDLPPSPLSRSESYRDTLLHIGEHDLLMYMNLSRFDAWLRAALVDPNAPPPENPNPMTAGMTPEKILNWLALDAILPYGLGAQLTDEGIATRARFGFSRDTALTRILIQQTDQPAPTPVFVHRGVQQVSLAQWSLTTFYEKLELELATLSPQAAMGLGMGRMMATGQLGIDFKTQLLDHLGGGLVFSQEIDPEVLNKMLDLTRDNPEAVGEYTQNHPTNGRYMLLGLEMKNRDGIAGALNTLVAKLHPQGAPEPERFMDHDIVIPMLGLQGGAPTEKIFSYTLLDGYLLIAIGNPVLLHRAIQASENPDDRLWREPQFESIRKRLPADGQFMEYTSGKQTSSAFEILEKSLGMLGEETGEDSPLKDLVGLGEVFVNSMGLSIQKGLVYEIEGFMAFGEPK